MNIVLIAPHQDDEILSSYLLLMKYHKLGANIDIVFATNGNYNGDNIASIRYHESCNALKTCGIEANHIHYMGYEDTGMHLNHSFLLKLYKSKKTLRFASVNHSHTWHPLGDETLHKQATGYEAAFCRKNFLFDLHYAISRLKPDLLIIPSCFDQHGDHLALSLFIRELLASSPLHPNIICYLIHTVNEANWPNRKTNFFGKPMELDNLIWEQRIIYSFSEIQSKQKKEIIKTFSSQNPTGNSEFLLSFGKEEEIFILY